MKTVKINNLEFPLFEDIADALISRIYFAVNCQYRKRLKVGVFQFQDSSYIPPCLNEFAGNIKGNDKLVESLNNELELILKV